MWAVVGLGFILLAVATVLAYKRYGEVHHPERHGHPERQWRRTDEIFKDPSTGRLMRVWLDPSDDSRHYLPD